MTKTATTTEKGYILVIDDDPTLNRSLKKLLEKEGYFVDVAHDGHEGIRKAKSGFFHLILCDVRMPGLNGLMTIQHIQDFQQGAGAGHSGFIVITAYDHQDHRQQACQLGVTDFLMKPFDMEKFLEIVNHSVTSLAEETPLQEVKRYNRKLQLLIDMPKK